MPAATHRSEDKLQTGGTHGPRSYGIWDQETPSPIPTPPGDPQATPAYNMAKAGCATVTPDLEESVAARWECGWAAPAATHLSPARMKMEQGRRRTGCCSWVLNGKPLSLVDCFQVSQPLGSESCSSCHAAGTSPCWAAQSQGKRARKALAIPCVLWVEEWKVACPPCAWGPFQCGL